MAEASEESDGFVIWGQNRVTGSLREHSIIWRIKNSKRMGEDYNRQVSHRGHMLMVRRKDALKTLGPSILEILFNENPLNELVAALKESSEKMVVEFLSDVRYILVSETDAAISDIAFLISHSILLNAFSFRNNQKTISDEDFEGLLPALSEAQIRLIDINGSCPTREFELIVKNLNMTLVRFHRYPGIDVEMFENTKVLNSAVEFVVAQGINPSADNSGIRFLKHLKNVFPAIRNIYWDWDMMMPTLTCLNDDVKACLDQLVGLYKEMEMNLLAILFFMSDEGSEKTMDEIWSYLGQFHLPNPSMHKISRDDKPHYCPPYMLFITGTSEKISRLEKIIVQNRIVEPDLRHFLYVQNRSVEIYKNDNVYEFLGFDLKP